MCFFFFFKQSTAYGVRISDWSSDVCSSDLGVCAREIVEAFAVEDADLGIGHRGHAVGAFLAERAADEIGRKDDADDLLAPVGGRDDQLQHALQHIGDDRGVIALPQQGMARLDAMIPSEFAEQRQFVGIEAWADGPVTEDRKSTRLKSMHLCASHMPSSA